MNCGGGGPAADGWLSRVGRYVAGPPGVTASSGWRQATTVGASCTASVSGGRGGMYVGWYPGGIVGGVAGSRPGYPGVASSGPDDPM